MECYVSVSQALFRVTAQGAVSRGTLRIPKTYAPTYHLTNAACETILSPVPR